MGEFIDSCAGVVFGIMTWKLGYILMAFYVLYFAAVLVINCYHSAVNKGSKKEYEAGAVLFLQFLTGITAGAITVAVYGTKPTDVHNAMLLFSSTGLILLFTLFQIDSIHDHLKEAKAQKDEEKKKKSELKQTGDVVLDIDFGDNPGVVRGQARLTMAQIATTQDLLEKYLANECDEDMKPAIREEIAVMERLWKTIMVRVINEKKEQ